MALQHSLLEVAPFAGPVVATGLEPVPRGCGSNDDGERPQMSSCIAPNAVDETGVNPEVLARRLNRWKDASRRYARQLEILGTAPDREYWINRFLRAATKAGRAAENYFDRSATGLAVLQGPCFGPWCSPPVARPARRGFR
jgi:hypothetical protein